MSSDPVVGNGREKAVDGMENGRADGQPTPGDARTRHDAVQALSAVHARRGHRN